MQSQNILVAVDGRNDAAFRHACDLAKGGGRTLHILNVIEPTAVPSDDLLDSQPTYINPSSKDVQASDQLLRKYEDEARKAGVKGKVEVTRMVASMEGSEGVGLALHEAAKSMHADTVVVGGTGMDQVSSTLLSTVGRGPVRDLVSRNMPCGVEVVEGGKVRKVA